MASWKSLANFSRNPVQNKQMDSGKNITSLVEVTIENN